MSGANSCARSSQFKQHSQLAEANNLRLRPLCNSLSGRPNWLPPLRLRQRGPTADSAEPKKNKNKTYILLHRLRGLIEVWGSYSENLFDWPLRPFVGLRLHGFQILV